MAYQALYRAFRPQRFCELVGQDIIARTLQNALQQNRLAHAYLFSGPRGTGKTSTAKILAKAVNCLALDDGEPCGQCANCLAIDAERLIDVVEIDAASNRGIDEMRSLKEQVRFVPSFGKCKVYIIDEVHMLTTEAFNALLKTLEEPPAHVVFILATTDPQKLPPTVLSRTQRFDFKKIPTEKISSHLTHIAQEEGVSIEDEALRLIATEAAGGLRDAVSLLDQAISYAGEHISASDVHDLIGSLPDHILEHFVKALAANDYEQLFAENDRALSEGADSKALLRALARFLRRLFLLKVSQQGRHSDLTPLAQSFTVAQYEALLRSIEGALTDMRLAPDPQLVLEVALIDLGCIAAQSTKPETAPTMPSHLQEPQTAAAQKIDSERPETLQAEPSTASDSARTPQNTLAVNEEKPAPGPSEPAQPSPHENNSAAIASIDPAAFWPKVMDELRQKSIRLHAFMKAAKLERIEGDTLHIRFAADHSFHYNQMNQPDHMSILASSVASVAGEALRIIFHIDTEPNLRDEMISTTERLFGKEHINIIDD